MSRLVQKDKGWAWVIMCACAVCVMVTSGLAGLAGMFQKVFMEEFEGGVVYTSWVTSLFASLMQLTGPVSGVVCHVLGCRSAVLSGSMLLTAGLLLSAFCHSLPLLLLCFSLTTGLGLGLVYPSAVLAVNLWFLHYRPLVTGTVLASGGLGIMGMPLLCRWLLQELGWRMTLTVLAAISAQLVVTGAVLFPPPSSTPRSNVCRCRKKPPSLAGSLQALQRFQSGQILNTDGDLCAESLLSDRSTEDARPSDSEPSPCGDSTGYCPETPDPELLSETFSLHTETEGVGQAGGSSKGAMEHPLNDGPGERESWDQRVDQTVSKDDADIDVPCDETAELPEDLVRLPLLTKGKERLDIDVGASQSVDVIEKGRLTDRGEESAHDRAQTERRFIAAKDTECVEVDENAMVLKRTTTAATKNQVTVSRDMEAGEEVETTLTDAVTKSTKAEDFDQKEPSTSRIRNTGEEVSKGTSMHQRRERDRTEKEECERDGPRVPVPKEKAGVKGGTGRCWGRYLRVVSSPSLVLLYLHLFLSNAACGILLVHWAQFCLQRGSSLTTVSQGFSVNGLTLTLARFLAGMLVQDRNLDPLSVYVGLTLVTTFVYFCFPFASVTPPLQIFMMGAIGAYSGAVYSLLTEVTIQAAGLESLSLVFGIEMITAGLGFLLGPPIGGWLADLTASYDNAMYLAGFLSAMSALAAMTISVTRPVWKSGTYSFGETEVKD